MSSTRAAIPPHTNAKLESGPEPEGSPSANLADLLAKCPSATGANGYPYHPESPRAKIFFRANELFRKTYVCKAGSSNLKHFRS